jgi:hypothetical protein
MLNKVKDSRLTKKSLFVKNWKRIVVNIFKQNRKIIIENPYASFPLGLASLLAIMLSFVANPAQYAVVFFFVCSGIFLWSIVKAGVDYEFYNYGNIPIPIFIDTNQANDPQSTKSLEKLFKFIEKETGYKDYQKQLERNLDIRADDLIFQYKQRISSSKEDLEYLTIFLNLTRYRINQIKKKTNGQIKIYLGYRGLSCIGYLIGLMLEQESVVVAIYNGKEHCYDSRLYLYEREKAKTTITEFKMLKPDPKNLPKQLHLIGIDINNQLKINDPSLKKYRNIIHLKNQNYKEKYTEQEWLRFCQEIYHVLNDIQRTVNQEIILIDSMPSFLAIYMGTLINKNWKIQLTYYENNRENQGYNPLIKINEFHFYY